MNSKFIQVGNRVNLLLQDEANPKPYACQVLDIFSEKEVGISMPMVGGKLIALRVGTRLKLVFYTAGGLVYGDGIVKERYNSNNIFLMRVIIRGKLQKSQRREYYRMQCLIDVTYYDITEEQAEKMQCDDLKMIIQSPEIAMTRKAASLVDLSGGGARYITESPDVKDSYVLLELELNLGRDSGIYLVPARVISSKLLPIENGKYESRIVFVINDEHVREAIIRFVFEEERRKRIAPSSQKPQPPR